MIDPALILLHLSDAHFGSKSYWDKSDPIETARVYIKEVGDALKSYGLLENGGGFDAIVLSGDCTWGPDAHTADQDYHRGYEVMKHFLKFLVTEARWVPSAGHVIIVPGNHDVMWGATNPASGRIFLRRRDAERGYRDMLHDAFDDDVRREHPHLSYCAKVKKGDRTFVILGLNSTRIERPERPGIGYVGDDQLKDLASLAEDATESQTLVAVLHHHLHANSVGLEELACYPGEHESTFVADSSNLTATLTGAGTSLVMHGHLHKRWEWAYSVPGSSSMVIHGAGSFGLSVESKQIFAPHQFQVFEVRSEEVRCHSLFAELTPRGTERKWQYDKRPPFRNQSTIPLGNHTNIRTLMDDKKAERSRTELMLFESCAVYDGVLRVDKEAMMFLKERVYRFYTRSNSSTDLGDFDSLYDAVLARLLSEYPINRAQDLHRRIFEEQMPLWILIWKCYFPARK